MTVSLRVPDNQEPVFFVWDLPDFTTKLCSKFPIGSKELQTLLEVSQHLHAVVYDIYRRNVQNILKQYANYETPLNCIVFSISNRPNLSLNSIGDISHIQQFMIQQVKALGIPCPNKHLGLEDIPRLNQALEDRNLQKIWRPISQVLAAVEGKPAVNAPAQVIRHWMNENKNHLQGIALLTLSRMNLTTIPREIILFTGLQQLDLSYNKITVLLPQGIFAGLIQLQRLFLQNNKITVLPQGIFDQLIQLQMLALQNNQISILPQSIFDQLIQLRTLLLNNNQISTLPQSIFDQLIQLQTLFLQNNQISTLPQVIFNRLNQLLRLYLYGNPRLLFSYRDTQTPALVPPLPGLYNDLTTFKEFNTYVCRSSFAKFYQFAAQENSFDDVMRYFLALPQYVRAVIHERMCEEQNNSSSPDFRIDLKKAVRWIFEMSTDELKNDIYARVLQLAQESDAVKRLQNPELPPEDFTHPNWGEAYAKDNILRLIDAMSLSLNGLLG